MTDATTPKQPRTAQLARIPALLEQHAGHESWGENDGRLDSVLLAWGLNPTDFMESLLGWGYTIAIEAQARPAAASEGLRARKTRGYQGGPVKSRPPSMPPRTTQPALDSLLREVADISIADSPEDRPIGWEDQVRNTVRRVRAALASAAGSSVGALDVERLARALHEAKIGCWGPEPIHDGVPDAIGQTEVSCTVRWNGTTPSSHEYEARAIVAAYLIEPAMTALSATRAATTPDDAQRQGES